MPAVKVPHGIRGIVGQVQVLIEPGALEHVPHVWTQADDIHAAAEGFTPMGLTDQLIETAHAHIGIISKPQQHLPARAINDIGKLITEQRNLMLAERIGANRDHRKWFDHPDIEHRD